MYSIHLGRVQAAGERLFGQMLTLEDMSEELTWIERSISTMSFAEEAGALLKKSQVELKEEIRGIHQMSKCLSDAVMTYEKTERRIADLYDLETIWHPKTRFGVSRITGAFGYKPLACLRNYFGIK